MFHYIDPFLWQLVIVPTFTIGLGVAIALHLKRLSIAPLVTLIAYLGMEWFMYRGTSSSLRSGGSSPFWHWGSRSRSSENVRWSMLRSNDP